MNFKHIYISSNKTNSPTLLVFHGMSGDEKSLLNFAKAIAPGANILSLKGQVIESGKVRFYKSGFLKKDIKKRVRDIKSFLDESSIIYGFDKNNIYALGWSNGANMVALIFLYKPSILKGGVLFRTLLPQMPAKLINLADMPIFISGAIKDLVDSPKDSEKLAEIFKSLNANVTFRWHKRGHELGNDDKKAAKKWWTKNVKI